MVGGTGVLCIPDSGEKRETADTLDTPAKSIVLGCLERI